MANPFNLYVTPQVPTTFPNSVYRIQYNDPIIGGEDGVCNISTIQLTHRTDFLKEKFLDCHNIDGTHSIKNEDVSVAAGIEESKLALDYSTQSLLDALDLAEIEYREIMSLFTSAFGEDGKYIFCLAKRTALSWRYSTFGFAFELWNDLLTLHTGHNFPVNLAVANDNTIDFIQELDHPIATELPVGQPLAIYDENNFESITVTTINTDNHVVIDKYLDNRYSTESDGSSYAYVGQNCLVIKDGIAEGNNGRFYLSDLITILNNVPSGKCIIRRDTGVGDIEVYYRVYGDTTWNKLTPVDATSYSNEWYDVHYELPGKLLYLKIVTPSAKLTKIKLIGILGVIGGYNFIPIKTPYITSLVDGQKIRRGSLSLGSSKYYAAWRDPYYCTEYRIIDNSGVTVASYSLPTITATAVGTDFITRSGITGIYASVPSNRWYTVQCRHVSDLSQTTLPAGAPPISFADNIKYSDWSDSIKIFLNDDRRFFGFKDNGSTTIPDGVGAFGDRNNITVDSSIFSSLHNVVIGGEQIPGQPIFGFLGVLDSYGFGSGYFVN